MNSQQSYFKVPKGSIQVNESDLPKVDFNKYSLHIQGWSGLFFIKPKQV